MKVRKIVARETVIKVEYKTNTKRKMYNKIKFVVNFTHIICCYSKYSILSSVQKNCGIWFLDLFHEKTITEEGKASANSLYIFQVLITNLFHFLGLTPSKQNPLYMCYCREVSVNFIFVSCFALVPLYYIALIFVVRVSNTSGGYVWTHRVNQ